LIRYCIIARVAKILIKIWTFPKLVRVGECKRVNESWESIMTDSWISHQLITLMTGGYIVLQCCALHEHAQIQEFKFSRFACSLLLYSTWASDSCFGWLGVIDWLLADALLWLYHLGLLERCCCMVFVGFVFMDVGDRWMRLRL
jgi:hypothetical protein